MVTGVDGRNNQGNLGGYLLLGVDKAEQDGHPIGGGRGDGGGRWTDGRRCGYGYGQ